MTKFQSSVRLLILALIVASCEKEKTDLIDQDLSSPFLLTADLSVSSVNLDLDTSIVHPLGNNHYEVTIAVEGRSIRATADEALHILLQVVRPNELNPIKTVEIGLDSSTSEISFFHSQVSFLLRRADIGLVKIQFAIRSTRRTQGNIIQKFIRVTRFNSRPRIIRVFMPDSITLGALPSPDSTFLVAAAVADSDGINDINTVQFHSIKPDSTYANNGEPIPLYDDGNQFIIQPPAGRSGDGLEGDGTFSRKVLLLSSVPNRHPPPDTLYTQRGNYTFIFRAIDNSGEESDPVVKIIKVK